MSREADLKLYGADLFGEPMRPPPSGPVAATFLFPPFSVLDGRSEDWQERKRAWMSLGIQGEVGRNSLAGGNGTSANSCYIIKRNDGTSATAGELHGSDDFNASSVFDPALCETVYRWFSGDGAQVLDPFAGGSVRGVVASCMGRRYWGCDLRPEQIAANETQAKTICREPLPSYVCGDAMDVISNAPDSDLVFSCPPYGDLERYSDDARDLSTMEWFTFEAAYKRIVLRACAKLREHRFACFVVGDFRDPQGYYRDFVSLTVQAFREQGLHLYNEAILVTPVGSAALRVTRQFNGGRKLCKTHQNVLVFCKGDWRKAVAAMVSRA